MCSCGNDVSVLLFRGHVVGLFRGRLWELFAAYINIPARQHPQQGGRHLVHQEMAAMLSCPHQLTSHFSCFLSYQGPHSYLDVLVFRVHRCKPCGVDQTRLGFSASTKAPGLAVPHSLGRKCSPRNHKPPFPTGQAAGTAGIFATVPLRA